MFYRYTEYQHLHTVVVSGCIEVTFKMYLLTIVIYM